MSTSPTQSLPVLLVSESPVERAQLARAFHDQLIAVADAGAALDAVRRQTFAAILFDQAMRGAEEMSRLVGALRAAGDATPVLALPEAAEGAAAGTGTLELLLFVVAEQRHALPVGDVQSVLPAVTIAPLPGAPDCVAGVMNVRGALVPVLDLRQRLGLAPKAIELDDHLIVLDASGTTLALHVDRALEIRTASTYGESPHGGGRIARLADGLVFVHDPRALLSAAELVALSAVCRSGTSA